MLCVLKKQAKSRAEESSVNEKGQGMQGRSGRAKGKEKEKGKGHGLQVQIRPTWANEVYPNIGTQCNNTSEEVLEDGETKARVGYVLLYIDMSVGISKEVWAVSQVCRKFVCRWSTTTVQEEIERKRDAVCL